MYRVLTSSNRALAQQAVRSTLTFTRAASGNEPEAGSVGSDPGAFGKREKAEETRWTRRHEAEQAEKHRAAQNKSAQGVAQQKGDRQASNQQQGGRQAYGQQQPGKQGAGGSSQQRLNELEAEKRRIDQEIADLKRQQR